MQGRKILIEKELESLLHLNFEVLILLQLYAKAYNDNLWLFDETRENILYGKNYHFICYYNAMNNFFYTISKDGTLSS